MMNIIQYQVQEQIDSIKIVDLAVVLETMMILILLQVQEQVQSIL